jgi:hypothetical protein
MIGIFAGFIIILGGLYYIPLKEAESNESDLSRWFSFIVTIWALIGIGYIPLILDIFLDGLVKSGYIDYKQNAVWLVSIGTFVMYGVVYKFYTLRLEACKARLRDDKVYID